MGLRRETIAFPGRPGFTAIELMVVVAIIAILSTLAIPTFQARAIRKQIEAALPLADIAKKPIAASWSAVQALPADNTEAGLPAPDKIVNNYVSNLVVQDGAIHLTFGNRAQTPIAGKILSLRPAVVADAPVVPIAWVCGKAEAPDKMTVQGQNRTTVPDAYLPLECRQLRK